METTTVKKGNEDFVNYSPSSIFEWYAKAPSKDLVFDFKKTQNEDYLCVYNLQVHSHQQNNAITDFKNLPPTYRQNVCGVFQLSEKYPTKLDLSNSWNKSSVKDNTCFFYKVNEKYSFLSLKR